MGGARRQHSGRRGEGGAHGPLRAYEDFPTSQIAWELQAWRDNPEGGLQGYREKLGLESRSASLPLMQGHSSLLAHQNSLVPLPCDTGKLPLLITGGELLHEQPLAQRLHHGNQSIPSGSENNPAMAFK